jgi:Immunity protein 74
VSREPEGAKRGKARLSAELTEGAIRVYSGKRSLTIYAGSDLPEAEVPADFVIRLDDILTWDPPNETMEVGIEELQKIVAAIEAECEKRGLVIIFE